MNALTTSNPDRDALRAEFRAFLDETGITQNRASESMKYAPSTISQWANGEYPGKVDEVDAAVRKYLKRQKNRQILKKARIIKTENYRRGKKLIANVHESKFIGLMTGAAGLGKTTIGKAYNEENPQTSIYVLANGTYTKQIILEELAGALKVKTHYNYNLLARQISEALVDGDYVVIVDQADYLKGPILELLRHVVMDQGQAGLVLMGLPRLQYLLSNVQGDHDQITSRIGMAYQLKAMTPAEAEEILGTLWADLPKEVAKECIEFVGDSYRVLANLIENIQRVLVANNMSVPNLGIVDVAGRDLFKLNARRK